MLTVRNRTINNVFELWNIGHSLSTSGLASEYWTALDTIVAHLSGRPVAILEAAKQTEIDRLKELGEEGIFYWKDRISEYKALSKEEAIDKLIKAEKIESKIRTIQRAISWKNL